MNLIRRPTALSILLTVFASTLGLPSTALAQGAAQLAKAAHAMLAVHNLDKLEGLAKALANVLKR